MWRPPALLRMDDPAPGLTNEVSRGDLAGASKEKFALLGISDKKEADPPFLLAGKSSRDG